LPLDPPGMDNSPTIYFITLIQQIGYGVNFYYSKPLHFPSTMLLSLLVKSTVLA